MSNRLPLFGLLTATFAFPAAALAADSPITGPFTHENLSIFLIHSARNTTGHKLLTLQEAMEQKKATVYETGSVNQLSIENRSSEPVYIQAGDIVKGGRQDRVLTTDLILPAHSGKLPIDSFCVEHGRWTKRGDEASDHFSASNAVVAGNALKAAVRKDKSSQAEVWQRVEETRLGLDQAVASPHPTGISSSSSLGMQTRNTNVSGSMQLALENKLVADATGEYLRHLEKIVDGQSDVVGFAYSVNGKLSSAEVYASRDLFLKMWPKLLASSAAEALAEKPKAQVLQKPPSIPAVQAILSAAESAGDTSSQVNGRLTVVKKESSQALLFETRDHDLEGGWMHRSIVVK